MGETRKFPSVLYQYALACNLTSCYYMLTIGEGMPGWFFPQVLLVYGPLLYLLNDLFLRRERTLLGLIALNILACGGMVVGYLLLERWRGIAYAAFSGIFLVWLTIRGSQNARTGPSLRGSLLLLDASFLLLVAFVGYASMTGLGVWWSFPALSGLCAAILTTASLRSPRSLGLKGWLAVGGAFGVLCLLLFLFMGAAAPAGQGVVALWSLLVAVLGRIKHLILGGLLWLLSLLPTAEPGEMEQFDPEQYLTQMEELPAEEANPVLGLLMLAALLVGGMVLAVWLIRKLRSIRLHPVGGAVVAAQPKRKRVSLWRGLVRLARTWFGAAALRVRLWRDRNTPAGLYFLLVHRCRRAPWHKRVGETPREFLLRLAAAAGEDGELAEALGELARETDAALYSACPVRKKLEQAPYIRRRIGFAVRMQFVRKLVVKCLPFAKKTPAA